MSEKQYAALQRILRKHEASGPIAPVKESASPAPRPTYTQKNHPKPGRSHRPVRVRSSNRKAKWIAFLVIGGLGALLGALGDDTSRSTFSGADRREAVSAPLKKVGQVDEMGVSVSPRPKPMPPRKQTQPKAPPKSPHSVAPRSIRVVDGDTIRLGATDQSTRLVGFNTPETWKPRCSRGEALGKQATARLSQLVRNAKTAEVEFVQCACKPGTHGTKNCNFGRACAYLRIDGRDVGGTLIAEGLAARFVCGRTSCPPLPRPWCP